MLCGRSFGQTPPKFGIPVLSSIAERIPTHPIESISPALTRSSLSLDSDAPGNNSRATNFRISSNAVASSQLGLVILPLLFRLPDNRGHGKSNQDSLG